MRTWNDLDQRSKAIIEKLIADVRHLPWFADLDSAHLDRCSPAGDSLLHSAATLGNTTAIEILVFLDLDINQRGEHGFTPLHEAALQGNVVAYNRLLELGANASAITSDGQTAAELLR